MSQNPTDRGFGYATAALRIEHRPQFRPFSREELIQSLDLLEANGVDAWWYSAAVIPSLLIYPSQALPYSDRAVDLEHFRWLADQCHQRGIAFISHYCITAAPLALQVHPEWAAVSLQGEHSDRIPCFNSPFGDRLKDMVVEFVTDLGFDGVWFDCTDLAWKGLWTCACDHCRARFHQDTGRTIPAAVDFDNADFRAFYRWRQTYFMSYIGELADHVRAHNPKALIILNTFNRLNHGGETGIPLLEIPADILLATEVDWRPNQALLQMKYCRAMMGERYAPESWLGFSDATHVAFPSRPEPDPAGLILFGLACMTGGGYPSYGGGESLGNAKTSTLRAVSDALRLVAPYVGGQPVRFAGLVLSSATNDFAHRVGSTIYARPVGDFWRGSFPAWRAVHGLHYLLNSLHLPSGIILDNQFTDEHLAQYPLIFLSDIQCLADDAAAALRRYVERGGILIATGDSGLKDGEGLPRTQGALDDLLGITARVESAGFLTLHTIAGDLRGHDLPETFMISGQGRAVSVAPDVTVLAEGQIITPRYRRTPTGDFPLDPPVPTHRAAITARAVGAGSAIYIAPNVGADYAASPNRRSRMLLDRLIRRYCQPPYEVTAPWNIVVTAWQQDENLVFHILNQPTTMCQLLDDNAPFHPEDVSPTGPISIRVPRHFAAVDSPTGYLLDVNAVSNATTITLERLDMHAVVRCASPQEKASL